MTNYTENFIYRNVQRPGGVHVHNKLLLIYESIAVVMYNSQNVYNTLLICDSRYNEYCQQKLLCFNIMSKV